MDGEREVFPTDVPVGRIDSGSVLRSWQAAAGFCLLTVALLVALLLPTASQMVSTWYHSVTFNHGFLIVPIAAYFVWVRRHRLAAVTPRAEFLGLLPLLAAAVAWFLGRLNGTAIVEEFALVALVQSAVLTTIGWPATRLLLFPLLYLYFAVPAGEVFVPPLQNLTAKLAVHLVALAGVPVYSDGLLISVPNGNWLVAEACSGIRYLIATLALSTLFAQVFLASWRRRLAFIAISVLIAIGANGMRAAGIILLGYATDNELAVGVDHIVYGFVFFSLVTLLTLWVGLKMRTGSPASNSASLAFPSPPSPKWRLGILLAATASLAIVAAATITAEAMDRPPPHLLSSAGFTPSIEPPWTGSPGTVDPAPIPLRGADHLWYRAYQDGADRVYVRIAYFDWERPGFEAVTAGNLLSDDKNHVSHGRSSRAATINGTPVSVNCMTYAVGSRSRALCYWYWIDGRYVGNPYVAKLLQLKAKLFGGQRTAAIITIATDYVGDPALAEHTLSSFLAKFGAITR
ncbi:MAG TPA: exosortase A [Alphaproteobacteria bacterium]|nr:exosortase A [Alphaproteobacteria bacterium]